MLYKMILEDAGYKTINFASNGKEAIEKIRNGLETPDIIIMDHRMPILSGLEAMKEILRFDKSPKIIFASADESVKEEAISMGAVAFLSKPFNIQELYNLIKKVLME